MRRPRGHASLERRVAALSALVMVAVGAGAVAWRWRPSSTVAEAATTRVTSTARHRFADLDGLVAASDLVVVGRVVAEEAGRSFGGGDPDGGAAIRSHLLTVEVERVLGDGPDVAEGTVVLVEEEHSLIDGTRLVVDGMRPGRVGDRGVWFLVAGGDPELPAYAVVNSQGRYLFAPGGGLHGGDRSDRLVHRIEARGRAGLEDAVRTVTPGPFALSG